MNRYKVRERTSAIYQATVASETGAGVPADELTAITLTLYDKETDAIINSRDAQDVLNENGVTIDEAGLLEWTLTPDDNVILGDGDEIHVALFEYEYEDGKKGNHEVEFFVQAVERVP